MEQNRINTGRVLARDSTLGARVMQQIGLIEVHDETFEKVAVVNVTSDTAHTAQEIIEEYKGAFECDLGTY